MDGDKDSFLLDERFSLLIVVRLIRNNWKAVIENYPTSLIGDIWFDLQDKQLLGIILLPLLVKFGLIWFDLQDMGSCFGPIFGGCYQGPIASTGPIFNPVLGLRLGSAHLLFQTPSVPPPPPQPLTKRV